MQVNQMRMAIALFVASGVVVLPGCSSQAPSPVAPTVPMVMVSAVSGTVREISGGALAGAMVSTRSDSPGSVPSVSGPSTITDANGEFSLPAWEMPAQLVRASVHIEGPSSSRWISSSAANMALRIAPLGGNPMPVEMSVTFQRVPKFSTEGLDLVVSNENFDLLAGQFSCDPCGTATFQPDSTSDVVLEAEWATSDRFVFVVEGISGGYGEESEWLGPVEAAPGAGRLSILIPKSFVLGLNSSSDLQVYIGPRDGLAQPVTVHLALKPLR